MKTDSRFFARGGRLFAGLAWCLAAGALADDGARGDAVAGAALFAQRCPVCHGVAGESPSAPDNPVLASQHSGYLQKQMRAYKSGARQNPVMNAMMASIDESQIPDLAAFLSAQTPARRATDDTDEDDRAAAESIYSVGLPARGLPACAACHGAAGRGIGREFPRLAGQNAAYLESQMRQFRDGGRKNDIMSAVAELLEDREIKILAARLSRM